eukprot:jgi/Mesen1/1588/ME000134S00697
MATSDQHSLVSEVTALLGREVRVFVRPAAISAPEEEPSTSSQPESVKDVDDKFFEFTAADYARVMASKREEVHLKTRMIREQEAAERRNRITKAVIRVHFPDGWIVEATFAPSDSVGGVHELVRRALARPEAPFYLYTAPPKQRLRSMEQSLYDAGLAPGALVYFSYEAASSPSPSPSGTGVDEGNGTTEGTSFLREEVARIRDVHLQPAAPSEAGPSADVAKESRSSEEEKGEGPPVVPPETAQAGAKATPGRKPKWFKM